MRAAPAVQVSVTRFDAWRAALGAGLATAWVLVGGWVVSHALAQVWPAAAPVAAAGALALLVASWLARSLARVEPFELRWDGKCWSLVAVGSTAADPVAGDVQVAVDLGAWLLLRFVPDPSVPGAAPRWLPVQRRGLARDWHGLRCALYSPRPHPAEPAGAPVE